MDTQCIPQTTKVGLDLDFVSTTKTEQSGIPGIFFDSQRKVYSRCAGSGCREARVVGGLWKSKAQKTDIE